MTRGGSLGGAWSAGNAPRIVDGCVVCPYHGWEFGSDGRCRNIPSIGYGTKPPPRAKVDSYPVQEKYGIVFAFLGDLPESERPPMQLVEEFDQDGWQFSGPLTFELEAYYERSIENGLDPVHNEFVHKLQGNIRFRADRMEVDTDEWGSKVYVRMDPPKPGTVKLEHLRDARRSASGSAARIGHAARTAFALLSELRQPGG